MKTVRGLRALALVVAFALAVTWVVVGVASAAHAAPQTVTGHIEDASGNDLANIEVIVADATGTFYPGLTDGSGNYAVNLPADDWYTIAAGSDTWVWDFTDPEVYVDGGEGPIDFVLEPGVAISGIVTDIADNSFVGSVDVFAVPVTGTPPSLPGYPLPGYIDFHGPTDAADGVYSITVPLNDDYLLVAYDENDDYDVQVYLGHNASGCLCDPDLVTITTGAAAGRNFQLYGFADWVHISVYAARQPAPASDFDGLLVTLQKKNTVTGDWDDVASETTNVSGLADLFGRGAGEYRIVYSEAGTALAALSAEDYNTGNPYSLSDAGQSLEFGTLTPPSTGGGGCGCGGGPGAFTEEIVDMLFPAAVSGGGSSGTGGGSTTPPQRPRTGVSTVVATLVAPTATPTPTPTPTSSPTPSSSPSSEPSATPSATPDPTPAGDSGFPWWIILIIVLAIGIIVTIIVLLRRR
jgi:hypothetical protein